MPGIRRHWWLRDRLNSCLSGGPGAIDSPTNIGASALTRLSRDILYRTPPSRGGATTDSLCFLLLISRRRFD